MNIQNITTISLILVTNIFTIHAMENLPSDTAKSFESIIQNSEDQDFTVTPKFYAILQTQEFHDVTHTPQYLNFMRTVAVHKLSKSQQNTESYDHIQEALENLLETEKFQLLFKPGIFSDNMILKNNAMRETEAYQEYQGVKELHKECPTALPQDMVDYCKNALRNTKEYEDLLKATIEEMFINNANASSSKTTQDVNSQEYSSNVFIKNRAMEQTPEHKQYKQAKLAYEQNPNADTEYMLDLCKAELRNTKECQEFLTATEQEKHITHNIVNSKKWEAEQSLSFQSLETLLNKKHDAWVAVKDTIEYQRFQQAKLDHERYNNEDTLFLLREHQQRAKITWEYREYDKINEELSARTGQPIKTNIYTIKSQPKTNNNSYAINNNNNDDDNNTTTASSTAQPQSNIGDCFIEYKDPVVPIKLKLSNDDSYMSKETCISSYFNKPTLCAPYNLQLQLSNNDKK